MVEEHTHIVMPPTSLSTVVELCARERYLVKIYQHRGSGGSLEETMSCFFNLQSLNFYHFYANLYLPGGFIRSPFSFKIGLVFGCEKVGLGFEF